MKYTGPACRLCRREGEKLFLKGDKCTSQKCPFLKKGYAPGMHGNKGSFGKKSEFNKQLRNKQKAKRIYGVVEKQFRRFFQIAVKTPGVTGDNILRLLELRLDSAVYKSGFASSRAMARQLVGHGLIKLNGRKCRIPSRVLKINDVMTVNRKTKGVKVFEGLEKQKDVSPKWLKVDLKKGESIVAFMPEKDDLDSSIDGQLIVESYSK